MFAKLLLLILAFGVAACALLAARHERLASAHRAAELHRRLLEQEQRLWALRGEVAMRTRPQEVQALTGHASDDWVPIPSAPAGAEAAEPVGGPRGWPR